MLKQFGWSGRLYQDIFHPLIQVGLFAPAEQSRAAATLGLLYYFVLASQKNLDMVLCRGTVRENISTMDDFLEISRLQFFGWSKSNRYCPQRGNSIMCKKRLSENLNLKSIDVLTLKIQLDRKYHANDLLPLKDEKIIEKVMLWLSKCVKDAEIQPSLKKKSEDCQNF